MRICASPRRRWRSLSAVAPLCRSSPSAMSARSPAHVRPCCSTTATPAISQMSAVSCLTQILQRQCPRINTMQSHYDEDILRNSCRWYRSASPLPATHSVPPLHCRRTRCCRAAASVPVLAWTPLRSACALRAANALHARAQAAFGSVSHAHRRSHPLQQDRCGAAHTSTAVRRACRVRSWPRELTLLFSSTKSGYSSTPRLGPTK